MFYKNCDDAELEIEESLNVVNDGLKVHCPNIDFTFEVPCGRGSVTFHNVGTDFYTKFLCVCGREHEVTIS